MRKKQVKKDPVDEMYEQFVPFLEEMDGVKRRMLEDMVRTWCWYAVKVAELTRKIDVEGPVIEGLHGPRTNPTNTVLHQYAQRQGDYYSRIVKALPADGKDKLDALTAFVTN